MMHGATLIVAQAAQRKRVKKAMVSTQNLHFPFVAMPFREMEAMVRRTRHTQLQYPLVSHPAASDTQSFIHVPHACLPPRSLSPHALSTLSSSQGKLRPHEEARDHGHLVFVDTIERLHHFAAHSTIVFVSHQVRHAALCSPVTQRLSQSA